jgi:hypothetical protein
MSIKNKNKTDLFNKEQNQALYKQIMKAFKESLGITKQKTIAGFFGLKHLQDWKSGKSSPVKYLQQISKMTSLPIEWFYQENDSLNDKIALLNDLRFRALAQALEGSSEEDQRFAFRTIEMLIKELGRTDFIEVPVIANSQVRDKATLKGRSSSDIPDDQSSDARPSSGR